MQESNYNIICIYIRNDIDVDILIVNKNLGQDNQQRNISYKMHRAKFTIKKNVVWQSQLLLCYTSLSINFRLLQINGWQLYNLFR